MTTRKPKPWEDRAYVRGVLEKYGYYDMGHDIQANGRRACLNWHHDKGTRLIARWRLLRNDSWQDQECLDLWIAMNESGYPHEHFDVPRQTEQLALFGR